MSKYLSLSKSVIIVVLGVIGWALCGAIIGVGRSLYSMQARLIIHAIGAPVIFVVISYFYFRRLAFTEPLQTAVIFVAIVIVLDIFVVALLVEKSFAMFASLIGTWIPFALIFMATWFTGNLVSGAPEEGPDEV